MVWIYSLYFFLNFISILFLAILLSVSRKKRKKAHTHPIKYKHIQYPHHFISPILSHLSITIVLFLTQRQWIFFSKKKKLQQFCHSFIYYRSRSHAHTYALATQTQPPQNRTLEPPFETKKLLLWKFCDVKDALAFDFFSFFCVVVTKFEYIASLNQGKW